MGLEHSSEEGEGMFVEEDLQASGAGCCLGTSPCRVRSSRSTSGPCSHGWEQRVAHGAVPSEGHTHRLLFLISSSPRGLRVGTVTAHFLMPTVQIASNKWSSQAGYRDSILVSASAGKDGLESHLSDSKLTCRFSPLAIRILENKGAEKEADTEDAP